MFIDFFRALCYTYVPNWYIIILYQTKAEGDVNMANLAGNSRLVKTWIPNTDADSIEWIDAQYNVSYSIRLLIKAFVAQFGAVDAHDVNLEEIVRMFTVRMMPPYSGRMYEPAREKKPVSRKRGQKSDGDDESESDIQKQKKQKSRTSSAVLEETAAEPKAEEKSSVPALSNNLDFADDTDDEDDEMISMMNTQNVSEDNIGNLDIDDLLNI